MTLRQRESNPRSVAWAETQSLLDVAKNEVSRLRLRDLLRTIVEDIVVLIIRRRSHRFRAAVQVRFQGDGRRDYLIRSRSVYGHKREWQACSLLSDLVIRGARLATEETRKGT